MSIFSHLFHSYFKQRGREKGAPRGFTLIELLVVLTIMVIITATLLVQQSRFDSATLLRSSAYSVALSVRQAQVYGSSVVGSTTVSQANCGGTYANNACFSSAYGIHLNIGSPNSYVLFADLNNDGMYELGEDTKIFTLNPSFKISNVCVTVGAINRCWNPTAINNLDILFRRPNPDACFSTELSESAGACAAGTPIYSKACIQLMSHNDATAIRNINISVTGEITVSGTCP